MIRILLNYLWFTLLLLGISVTYFLTETTAGLQLGLDIATAYLPGKLHYENLQGSLLTYIAGEKITYQNDTLTVSIRSLKLHWDPLQLFANLLDIHSLTLNDVIITILPSKTSQVSFDPASIPMVLSHIRAHNVNVNHLTVFQNHRAEFQLSKVVLQQNVYQSVFSLDGHFRDYPVRGQVNLEYHSQGLVIHHATLQVADAFVHFTGKATDQWNMQWDIFIPNLHKLIPEAHGSYTVTGRITGPQTSPALEAKLHESIPLTPLGITLKKILVKMTYEASGLLRYTGSFESLTGTAGIEGTTQLTEKDFPTLIQFTGNNLQIANLPEYKINVNTHLTVKLTYPILELKGDINIPEAKIFPKDFRNIVTLPSEVVWVGQKQKNPLSLLDSAPTMQIALSLGNNVLLHYQDFESHLRGNLMIRKNPNSLVTASGELYTMNGTYQAYHQRFQIQEGRLVYTGGLISNPGLNIKAVRQLRTTVSDNANYLAQSGPSVYTGSQLLTVGVQIQGTLESPAITLYSDPSDLSQANILSYLLFGVPEPTSGSEKNTMLSAASALNLASQGSSPISSITGHIQQGLGLNELNVQSVQTFSPTLNQNNGGTVDNTSLVLGKEIAHNLYIHSSVSLFASPPVYIFNVQYKLGKHWSIQSETSTIDTGADLLYSIERE